MPVNAAILATHEQCINYKLRYCSGLVKYNITDIPDSDDSVRDEWLPLLPINDGTVCCSLLSVCRGTNVQVLFNDALRILY